MKRDDRVLLEELMAAMAEGDAAALFAFVHHFGGALAWVIRNLLQEFGRRDLLQDRDEIDGLVQDAAFVLFDRAAAWDPAGALPWVWAGQAIRAVVVRGIGNPTVELDADHLERAELQSPTRPAAAVDIDYKALRARDADFDLFCRAVGEAGSKRDQEVFHEYLAQKANGDHSPAHTVAAQFGLTPHNVRKIASRMSERIRQLIEADSRYRALSDRGWLAA